jgi:uncharacterized OB-fold protein
MTQKPFAEGVFSWPSDDPHLIGSRCPECSLTVFPKRSTCPGCPSEKTDEVLLENQGTLWTWTTQSFRPKEPYIGPEDPDADWVPYGVGYADLGDVRVEGRLTEADPAKVKIGMEVKLRLIPFGTDDEGNELVWYAFAPAGAES